MKNRRILPQWISNLICISGFIFCYLILYCKMITIGYQVSEMEKQLQQLKGWNQYYRGQLLRETSFEKVKHRAEQFNLSLEIPDKWRIVELQKAENANGEITNYANAQEKN